MAVHPLAVVAIDRQTAFMTRTALKNASTAPMITPCTTPEDENHARAIAITAKYHTAKLPVPNTAIRTLAHRCQ